MSAAEEIRKRSARCLWVINVESRDLLQQISKAVGQMWPYRNVRLDKWAAGLPADEDAGAVLTVIEQVISTYLKKPMKIQETVTSLQFKIPLPGVEVVAYFDTEFQEWNVSVRMETFHDNLEEGLKVVAENADEISSAIREHLKNRPQETAQEGE